MYNHLHIDVKLNSWIEGHLGVDLFFIISGFLITTLLRRENHFNGGIDLRGFYWRRFFRIIPVYGTVLALYIAVCQLPSQAEKWVQLKGGLPYFLTMMNEYVKEPHNGTVFTHTWSLGVEEKFYLVWPMLFFTGGRSTRWRVIIVGALLLGLMIPTLFPNAGLAVPYFGLMMGALMAIALSGPHAGRILAALARIPPFAALGIFLLGFGAVHVSFRLISLFSTTSVIFLSYLLARDTWISRFHELPLMVWFGKRSYSMYLVHILCLNALAGHVRVDSGWKVVAMLVAAYLLSAAVADVLYRTVENPARKAGRAYLARHEEVSAAI